MDNREVILQCALELFYRRGYDAAGVQEIVEMAGITKPTMYYYYKSKLGLLEALIEEKGELLLHRILEVQSKKLRFEEQLYQLAKVYLDFGRREHYFYFLMLGLMYSSTESEAHKAAMPFISRQYELIIDTFVRAGDYLGNMNGRQEQFAIGFLGVINCYMMVYNEKSTENMLSDEKIYAVVHQFLHGIYS
ncbi:MAG: TetR/AcrR family transcriptional regulator [Lachnospiraceae bacterium]|nr:TetR/AcrR family transcriptional regulator [Lachnospiraceae bacterium]